MTEDKYGAIWIADDQGRLMRCAPKSRRIVTDSKGSSQRGDAIRSLVADSMGHLWIISNQTAKEYNPKSGACRVFRSSDRNIDMDCFLHATPTKDGVCIEGAGGLLYIRSSENLSGRSLTAKPLVTSIAIDGKGMLVGSRQKAVTLPPDAASFEVQLSTLNLLHADKIQYAYRLNGMDDKWHYLPMGLNKAVFVKLPKGKYTLEIMATDEFGRWGQKVQALTLHRLPAWWETTLAQLLYLLGAILAVGIGVRIYLARQQEKQQEEMNSKLTEMKISFFTNISHELRTPLTLILTPLESLMHRIGEWRTTDKEDDRWNDIYQRLHVVDNNAQRLLGMVNKLLDFRKIEAGQMVVNLSGGDIYDFVRTTCVPFQELAGEKGIAFVRIIPTQALYVNFDSDKLGHILNNLLSNAFKFTPAGSSVTVKAMTDNDENICITVADKGYGITKQDLPHIFDLYYQSQTVTSHAQPGTGIGLHLTKEYVQLLGGSINVESNAGKGTEFTVRLPLATHDNVAQEVVDIDHEDREAPHILIVDDNREFRNFVVLELGRSYNMLQADNGQEALDIARKQEVDLIVSDVMMPYMDGLELCRQLRNDISLSHIMALLLSAKTSEECKKEGFLAGADDYLCKPFSMEMLLLRIQHLLDMRERRNKRFQQEQSGDMNNITTNDTDRRFLEDAIKQVEQHLMDENYDVDMLAADVNISRSTFYRKIHSLTGLKPTIFIRNIRLKHAARLIREGNHRIIEVADLCGFSSPSYFSRCFHEQYGISPANYKSKKN
jgi:signal transduction histidine kinase/DNA-binding response OmpR family regulator